MKFQFLPENFSRSENAPPFETRKIRQFEVERIFLKNKKMLDDFFSSPEVYGVRENRGWNETLTFIRGTVDLQTSIPHLILDGSALMSDVRWRGFHIFNHTCPNNFQNGVIF